MTRSFRNNQQRYHRSRQGQILVPHGGLSGLLFTINPRQDTRAQREAQLYLADLVCDIKQMHEAFIASQQRAAGDDAGNPCSSQENSEEASGVPNTPQGSAKLPRAVQSTSSLLAAELATAAQEHGSRKRERENEGEERVDGDNGVRRPKRVHAQWLAALETNCKGYLFLSIPAVNSTVTCRVVHAASKPPATEVSTEAKDETEGCGRGQLPPHSIVVNPLVSHVVERLFRDLTENPRPIFRHCFRLMPVELTCCPTLPEMQKAVTTLLTLYFPPPSQKTAQAEEEFRIDFTKPMPVADVVPPLRPRSMRTVTIQLTVKNNTHVDAKRTEWLTALQAALPANRFIVPCTARALKTVEVDAVVTVFVLHSTCMMGVQINYSSREQYNLHTLSERALELAESVVKKDE